MTATLRFNLPDEQDELRLAQSGPALSATLVELDDYLRDQVKYQEMPAARKSTFQEVREHLHHLMEENEVRLR